MNDFFQAVGKQPSLIDLLIIAIGGPERFSKQCLRIQVCIPSIPGIGEHSYIHSAWKVQCFHFFYQQYVTTRSMTLNNLMARSL